MDSRGNSVVKNMSTPLRENNRRYSHSPLLSPASSRLIKNRYCVSDTSSPNSKILNNYSPGPLLTPTDYNTSLSTYIDCKSPGLSSRIVQYSGDTVDKTEPFISHQAKYGSPGIFPIVHLQKKNLPVRRLPRDSVTVRLIATHESPNYSGNSNGLHSNNEAPDISTNNVLKALREISKKRISEDITPPQNNHKRQCNDCHIEVPDIHVDLINVANTNVDASKKFVDNIPCVVDALAASLTSSSTALVNSRNMLKRKNNVTLAETSATKNPKQMSIEVETQTDNFKVNNVTQTVEEPKLPEVSFVPDTATRIIKPDIHTKVYEEALKNKLAIRLSAFTKQKPNLIVSTNSIMSPPDKPKHDKHVTFNLPNDSGKESVDEVVTSITPITVSVPSDKIESTTPTPVLTTEAPVTNSTVAEFSSASDVIPAFSQAVVTAAPINTPKPVVVTTTSSTSDLSKLPSVSTAMPLTSVTFTKSSGFPELSSPSLFTPSVAATSLHSSFNTISNQDRPINTTSSLTFGSVPPTEPKFNNSQLTMPSSSVPFGAIPFTVPKTLGNNTSVTTATSITFGSVPFSEQKLLINRQTEAISVPVTSGFVPHTEQKPPNEKVLGFNTSPSKPGGFKFDLGSPSMGVSTTPVTKLEPSFNFDMPKPATSINFGANTKVTSAFGASSIFSTGFETKSPPNVGFPISKDVSVSDMKSTFNSPAITTSSTGSRLFNFVKSDPAVPVFSTPTQATTNSNMFKFGPTTTATATLPFLTPAAINAVQVSSDSNTFKFGASVTTAPSMFNAPILSTSDESNMFKFGSSVFNSSSTFKDTKQPLNEPTSFKFTAVTTAPAFTASAFNSIQPPNESNAFKFGVSTTSTAASIFNKPSFNTSGQNQNEQSMFNFGTTSATTTAGPIFNAPTFNFSTPTNTSVSKAPLPPSFPTTTANFNTFGSFESKPANPFNSSGFGDTKSTVPFGTNQTFGAETKPASIFGTPAQNQNVFGTFNNQPSFGAAEPSLQTAPSQPFQFGASTNNSQPNVFSFGATNEPAKPATSSISSGVFSFGASTTNTTFGTTPTPAFGSSAATPNYGMQAPAVPNFGSPIQGTPMFSIGAGSSTPKPRTQLKARRRT